MNIIKPKIRIDIRFFDNKLIPKLTKILNILLANSNYVNPNLTSNTEWIISGYTTYTNNFNINIYDYDVHQIIAEYNADNKKLHILDTNQNIKTIHGF